MTGINDQGEHFELSPDPLLDRLSSALSGIRLGDHDNIEEKLRPVMADAAIFGVDLYEIGMDALVCGYFEELNAGPGAVRQTLKKYVSEV